MLAGMAKGFGVTLSDYGAADERKYRGGWLDCSGLGEERRVDVGFHNGLVAAHGNMRWGQQEDLARDALNLAVEPLGQSAREVDQTPRLWLTHLGKVDDYRDAVPERLGDGLGIPLLARVDGKDLVHIGVGGILLRWSTAKRGDGGTVTGGLRRMMRLAHLSRSRRRYHWRGILVVELLIGEAKVDHGLAEWVSHSVPPVVELLMSD